MKWLHLSDIHFADFGFDTGKLKNALLNKLKTLSPNLDFILITGDCFYQNNSSRDIIPDLGKFIIAIGKACHVDKNKIYLCQGNHDLNRNDENRNNLVEQARTAGILTSESYNSLICQGNDNFRSLFRLVKGKEYLDYEIIQSKKHGARIISINSCLLSKDNTDYQKLRVCVPILEKFRESILDDSKLNIVIMHHGIDWLCPDDGRSFEHWLEDSNVDVLFVGHTHQPNVVALDDVNREIMQFTSGALMRDGYSIPSFYLCDEAEGMLTVTLFSYSHQTDSWEIDNRSLRKFRNDGKHHFILSRRARNNLQTSIDLSNLSCEELIQKLNDSYEFKYGSRRFFSDKTGEQEFFNAWKIVGSLVDIGISYPIALRLTVKVVEKITSDDYFSDNLVHSSTIKQIIYDNILKCHEYYPEMSEYEIGIWASTYAKHYDKNTGFMVVQGDIQEPISYSLLKSSIIKEVVVRITGNEVYFKKISTSELEKIASEVMRFIKSLGISEIKKEVLLDIITEFVSEPPRQWFVNGNREMLFNNHKESLDRNLNKLEKRLESNPILQIEAAYHLFAAYLTIYDDFIGCTEISPIIILKKSLGLIGTKSNDSLPMRRCMLIQLREDLRAKNIDFEHFRNNVYIVYKNIIERKSVTNIETTNALIELRSNLALIEGRIGESWKNTGDTFADVYRIFSNALGFIVRKPLRQFNYKAFVIAPHWDDYQIRRYNLGDDMLIYMLDEENENISKLCEYLSLKRKNIIQELVLFKPDLSQFTPEERKRIREQLKSNNVNVRCVFIQELNFQYIHINGWRKEFFKVVEISKNSKY